MKKEENNNIPDEKEVKTKKDNNFGLTIAALAVSIISLAGAGVCTGLTLSSKAQSAYDIAVKNGFTGTETEWLASLKGADGKQGEQGAKGDPGKDAVSVDEQTIINLNSKMATIDTTITTYPTAYQRFNACNINNESLKRLGDNFLYSFSENRFICLDHAGYVAFNVAGSNYTAGTLCLTDANLYQFNHSSDMSESYSNYLTGASDGYLSLSTTMSIDVGGTNNITNIYYTNDTEVAQTAIIRTNSAATAVSITAPLDNVTHYGTAGIVSLHAISDSSYFEKGVTNFIELNKGRVVLTKSSDVEVINITKKSANTYNNPIIANGGVLEENMPDIISRDDVAVIDASGKTELVKIQKLDEQGAVIEAETEQVYAYANESATKGSTKQYTEGSNPQNINVDSTLGKIVLDSTPAENAYDVEQKAEVKDEVAIDAATNEYADDPDNYDYVVKIGATGYETLEDAVTAVNAVTEEDKKVNFVILQDCTFQNTLGFQIIDIDLVINGNGYTITNNTPQTTKSYYRGLQFENADYTTYFGSDRPQVTVNDITVNAYLECFYATDTIDVTLNNCNGHTNLTSEKRIESFAEAALAASYDATLTVNGGVFTSSGYGASIYTTGGTITMIDVELTSGLTVNKELSYCYSPTSDESVGDSVINFNGGKYTARTNYYIYNDSTVGYEGHIAKTTINKGTFNFDPTTWVASGCTVVANPDGTWTVSPQA